MKLNYQCILASKSPRRQQLLNALGVDFSVKTKEIDESLIIPMENNVESLNLAVSCGVILFEAKRK